MHLWIATAEGPPPLALALEDFVPVVLSFVGLVYVARWLKSQCTGATYGLALLSALLIGLGGFAKATWKLLYALGPEVSWLD